MHIPGEKLMDWDQLSLDGVRSKGIILHQGYHLLQQNNILCLLIWTLSVKCWEFPAYICRFARQNKIPKQQKFPRPRYTSLTR